MSMHRREFLATMAWSGTLALAAPRAAYARWLPSAAEEGADVAPALVLVRSGGAGEDANEKAFANALRAAWDLLGHAPPRELRLAPDLLRNAAALRDCLVGYKGSCLVGLMADPAHLVFEEMVRELGGALRSRGAHAANAVGATSHHFLTVPASAGIGRHFAASLAPLGRPLMVREASLGLAEVRRPWGVPASGASVQSASPTSWPAQLGESYARIAGNAWIPGPVLATAGNGPWPASSVAVTHVATSFVAQL